MISHSGSNAIHATIVVISFIRHHLFQLFGSLNKNLVALLTLDGTNTPFIFVWSGWLSPGDSILCGGHDRDCCFQDRCFQGRFRGALARGAVDAGVGVADTAGHETFHETFQAGDCTGHEGVGEEDLLPDQGCYDGQTGGS
jgi:hypothetical protein